MNEAPMISVVTPTFNCAAYIRDCIESVLAQDYAPYEHIVVDGASTDGTVEILRQYPHLRWISEPDTGEVEALNKALKMVQGDIIGWLNADDYYRAGAFATAAREIDPQRGRHLIYGNTDFVDERGALIWHKRSAASMTLPLLLRFWLNGQQVHQPSIFYSRALIDDIGPFNPALHFSIDLEHWLRTVVKYRFHYVDQTLACARIRAQAKSAQTPKAQNRSHWKVGLPYHRYLSPGERAALGSDYLIQYHWPIVKAAIQARLRPGWWVGRLRQIMMRKAGHR